MCSSCFSFLQDAEFTCTLQKNFTAASRLDTRKFNPLLKGCLGEKNTRQIENWKIQKKALFHQESKRDVAIPRRRRRGACCWVDVYMHLKGGQPPRESSADKYQVECTCGLFEGGKCFKLEVEGVPCRRNQGYREAH